LFVHDGVSYNEVGTNIVSEGEWQTWQFIIDWTTQTVDVYLGSVLQESDVDCSSENAGTEGYVILTQFGYATNNRISYIDSVTVTNNNTVNYTTGAYSFICSAAPVNGGSVLATYKKVAGAPKSKGGFVRNERLYMWGSSDYPSRLFYSGTSDTGGEYEWSTSAGGGYLDFDKDDGYSITSCINFSQSVIVLKTNKAGRLDNFPGDSIFRIEPLNGNIQCNAYRSACLGGGIIAYQSPAGISAISPAGLYDENQDIASLSKKFHYLANAYNNVSTQVEYYPKDEQLWVGLGDTSSTISSTIYTIDIPSARVSRYAFAFNCTCIKYIDGMMLIGGADGNLYQMINPGTTGTSVFLDNSVSYAANTYFQTGALDWGYPLNDKVHKELYLAIGSASSISGTLYAYTDFGSSAALTKTIAQAASAQFLKDTNKLRYRHISIKATNLS